MRFLKLNLVTLSLLGLAAQSCNAIWPFSPKAIPEKIANSDLERLKGQINTENAAFVFDIHDVIVKFSLPEALAAVSKMSWKNQLHFAKKTWQYFRNNKNPKRAFEGVALEDKAHDQEYLQQAIAVMNPHVPNPETVAILQELKVQGYNLYGCSNIGERSYNYLKNKYPEAFKDIIACRTSNKSNNYCKKSDPKAYQEILDLIAKSGKVYEHLIFVDDKQSNLTLASQVDKRFVQLLLKDPKRLRPNLANLGILKDENK